MHDETLSFITVLQWPDGWDNEDRVRAVVESGGLDVETARLRAAWRAPCVVQSVESSIGPEIERLLREFGVRAFSISEQEMVRLGDPWHVKDMTESTGGYHLTFWRETIETTMRVDNLLLIVRASIAETKRGIERGVGGTRRVGRTLAEIPTAGAAARSVQRTRTSDKIDLYMQDGMRFRIDGDKFGWRILGKDRGFSDRENATRLALRLAENAPKAIVDTSFDQFTAVPGVDRAFSRGFPGVMHDSLFEAYSRLMCISFHRLIRDGTSE